MARPVTLFTGQWADLPLEELAGKASAWGFDGLELACWGDHFDVDEALSDPGYVDGRREILERHGLQCHAISTHLVGQAVCDPVDERHRAILPPDVWGDGDPEGVRSRAAEKVKDTARAAARFGVTQVNGFTGSGIWHLLYSFPPNDFEAVEAGYRDFAERWGPIVDVFEAEGVRYGLEVHPTEIAYDFVTTRKRSRRSTAARALGSTSTRATSPTSSSTRPRSSRSSPTASTTSTSRIRRRPSTGAARSSAAISTSGRPGAAGTSSLPGTGTSTSSRSSALSTGSATTGRSRSSGRMPAWIASGAPRTRWPSFAGATSPPSTLAFDAAYERS